MTRPRPGLILRELGVSDEDMLIRAEEVGDWPAVLAVQTAAFGQSAEADLVEALRRRARPVVSLVAEVAGAVVGHVMFSPVRLSGHEDLPIMSLAPLGVMPAYRRRGVGSALVRTGLVWLRATLALASG